MFDDDHPGVDHAVVHRDAHAACVRIVRNEALAQATEELQMLFPHDVILSTPMGSSHTCVYTHTASAAVVAERIAEHVHKAQRSSEG